MVTGCHFVQFTLGIDGFQMERYILGGRLEQFGDLCLRPPQGFVGKAALDAGAPQSWVKMSPGAVPNDSV